MIFPLNTLQLIISMVLYAALFIQGYALLKFIKRNYLLHDDVVGKIKTLSYIFIVLLIVKLTFSIMAVKGIDSAKLVHATDSYSTGYVAGCIPGILLRRW